MRLSLFSRRSLPGAPQQAQESPRLMRWSTSSASSPNTSSKTSNRLLQPPKPLIQSSSPTPSNFSTRSGTSSARNNCFKSCRCCCPNCAARASSCILMPQTQSSGYCSSDLAGSYCASLVPSALGGRQLTVPLLHRFGQADIQPHAEQLLNELFRLIRRGTTPQAIASNEALMKCASDVLSPG